MKGINTNMMSILFRHLTLLLFLCFSNCGNSTSLKTHESEESIPDIKEQIDSYFSGEFNITNINQYYSIIFITDVGCINCNKLFSKSMEKFTYRKDIIFIITSTGGLFDIEHYYELFDSKNIIIDRMCKFNKLKIMDGSGAIFINDKSYEIININSTNLENQITKLEKRLTDI